MVAKVATTGLHWSQPILPHSPSSSRALASAISSLSSSSPRRRLVCRPAALSPPGLQRRWSGELPKTKLRPVRRSCSARLGSFSDEEFSKKIEELALRFQLDSEEIVVERRAKSVELPVSMRMIKRKMRWREAGESAVKKAFSSMVFIIRELHRYSLQMRIESDLHGILERVHSEIHASFVWLFQQVFSHTPTLMVYLMILLANFTVYSVAHSPAVAIAAAAAPPAAIAEADSSREGKRFDSFSAPSISGGKRTISVGGGGGGGGRARPAASGTEGEGASDATVGAAREAALWEWVEEEAAAMRDGETVRSFVAPVKARMESDRDYEDYFKTELLYQTGLALDPHNSLLLANYAQFLYLVAHDYDRAEEYFKRAIGAKPADPAAQSKYATFLWRARKELWAAEEAYLEAISAEPDNSSYAADYAHFLWNTGAEDTCFPLSDSHPHHHHYDDES